MRSIYVAPSQMFIPKYKGTKFTGGEGWGTPGGRKRYLKGLHSSAAEIHSNLRLVARRTSGMCTCFCFLFFFFKSMLFLKKEKVPK